MSAGRHRSSLFAVLAVMLLFTFVSVRSSKENAGGIIVSDVHGYYGYLHAVFITHDLGHERVRHEYVNVTPNGTLNKYFAGEALLLTPFFLSAHAYVKATGGVADGFSPPYERAIAFAALIYALLGLLAFRALLLHLGISDRTVATVLLMLGFGTQLLQFTAVQPGWSHVYSFALFEFFLLLTQRIAVEASVGRIIAWGVVLGMIVLVRPVNGLVLLAVPVLLGKATPDLLRSFRQKPVATALMMLAGASIVAIQPILWHAQVGSFVAYGYKGEGFQWGRPAILQVLIGIRRGLFIWTPVLVLAAFSVPLLWKHDRFRAIGAALYWLVITYVISSWWIWYYGSGFGARVYVEHYTVFALPLAFMLDRWQGWRRMAAITFLVFASALQLAQCYQYNHGFLDRECMDRKKYAFSFLHFDADHHERLGGRYMIAPYNPNGMDTLVHVRWDAERWVRYWHGKPVLFDPAPSPWHVVTCDTTDEFGPSFEMPAKDLPTGRALYFALGFERYVFHADDTRGITVVASAENAKGEIVQYQSFAMEPMPPAGDSLWEHIEYRVPLEPLRKGERVKFYFWNQDGKSRFLVDDLDMTVTAVRPY
ncbi:MAG: hypothetical protein IPO60_15500 [Flavobacteriales bacterium]|nr:hypothetical protein [Flavobacteriales bacterium]